MCVVAIRLDVQIQGELVVDGRHALNAIADVGKRIYSSAVGSSA